MSRRTGNASGSIGRGAVRVVGSRGASRDLARRNGLDSGNIVGTPLDTCFVGEP